MCQRSAKSLSVPGIIFRLAGVIGVVATVGFLLVLLQGVPGHRHGDYAAFASLWNIRTGLWHYDSLNGHLPPAASTTPESEASCSWRVEVYQASIRSGLITRPERNASRSIDYDRGKPWHSPHNLRLQACGAYLFQYSPLDENAPPITNSKYCTYYMAITGPGTAFDPANPQSLRELPDDLILVVRVERSNIHWMEPGDLSTAQLMAPDKAKQLLLDKNGYAVLFADGTPWILSGELPYSDLRKFMSIEDARCHDRNAILERYRVL